MNRDHRCKFSNYFPIYCDNHFSLSSTTAVHIWIISYILHATLFVWFLRHTVYRLIHREFFENALHTGGIYNRRLFVPLKTGLVENDNSAIAMWFPWPSFLNHKSKIAGDCCIFNDSSGPGSCSGVVWTENIWWSSSLRSLLSVVFVCVHHWRGKSNDV